MKSRGVSSKKLESKESPGRKKSKEKVRKNRHISTEPVFDDYQLYSCKQIKSKSKEGSKSPKTFRKGHRKAQSQENIVNRKATQPTCKGNIISKYSVRTKPGKNEYGMPLLNEDSILCVPDFLDGSLFGICDGHGFYAHDVSNLVKDLLTENIEYFIRKKKSQLKKCLMLAFDKTSVNLKASHINTDFSGCSATIIMTTKHEIFCSHVGDSKAIMIHRDDKDEWGYTKLTKCHTPKSKQQAKRIISKKGRLQPYYDSYGRKVGPVRVWYGSQRYPGLAITRSFGDGVAKKVGVISTPDIIRFELSIEHKAIVVGSEGLWGVLTSQDVLRIIIPWLLMNDPERGSLELQKKALESWRTRGDSCQDLSVVVLFLKNY